LLGSIAARSGCVATSGDYETTFSADYAHHHIFDPHTGDSPPELASVTVVARNGLLADGLSTAAFVLGTRTGQALIERFGAQALFVHKDGTLHATSGFALRPAASA
jgi:thiamine biosynthesis lipoprotein